MSLSCRALSVVTRYERPDGKLRKSDGRDRRLDGKRVGIVDARAGSPSTCRERRADGALRSQALIEQVVDIGAQFGGVDLRKPSDDVERPAAIVGAAGGLELGVEAGG